MDVRHQGALPSRRRRGLSKSLLPGPSHSREAVLRGRREPGVRGELDIRKEIGIQEEPKSAVRRLPKIGNGRDHAY